MKHCNISIYAAKVSINFTFLFSPSISVVNITFDAGINILFYSLGKLFFLSFTFEFDLLCFIFWETHIQVLLKELLLIQCSEITPVGSLYRSMGQT